MTKDARHTVTVIDGEPSLVHNHDNLRSPCQFTVAFLSPNAHALCAGLGDGTYDASLSVGLHLHLKEQVPA